MFGMFDPLTAALKGAARGRESFFSAQVGVVFETEYNETFQMCVERIHIWHFGTGGRRVLV
jgi:hypothetical protein